MSDEPTLGEDEATIVGGEHVPAPPSTGATEEYPTLAGSYPTAGEEPDVVAPYAYPDPDADLEWVPRTTGGIRLGIPLAVLIAILLVAAGFWGGAALEKSHGGGSGSSLASLASRFRSARGGTGATGATGFAGFGGATSTAAATGTISVVDGDTLYVLTSTGSLVKVTRSKSTTLTRNADATPPDLRPGDTITVQGTTASDGNVAATSVAATAPGISSTSGGGFGGAGSATSTTAG